MGAAELADRARVVLDGNRYMALGTSEDDGRPRVSPVFFTHDGYRELFWVSSPDATHSRHVLARPDVAAVVFDSSVPVGGASAVYLTGTARQVPDDDLAEVCPRAYAKVKDGVAFGPDELREGAELRLYCLTVVTHEVLVRGRDPEYGTGIDRRVTVDL